MTGRLNGKTAVVVGAGQMPGDTIGNGKAMSILFAREGATVLCVDQDLRRAEDTVAAIEREGGKAFAFCADVGRSNDCAAIIEESLRRLGRLDILVNNVGIGGDDAPAHMITEEAWDLIMDVNLKSTIMTIRAALPIMREQEGGVILSISSLAATAGHDRIAYEVSKAGMNRLTIAVASSNAKYNVRCNAIVPGLMDTPMAIAVSQAKEAGIDVEELRARRNASVPMGRTGDAWDTAYAALFLASDEAKFITGVCLPVDGGQGVRVG